MRISKGRESRGKDTKRICTATSLYIPAALMCPCPQPTTGVIRHHPLEGCSLRALGSTSSMPPADSVPYSPAALLSSEAATILAEALQHRIDTVRAAAATGLLLRLRMGAAAFICCTACTAIGPPACPKSSSSLARNHPSRLPLPAHPPAPAANFPPQVVPVGSSPAAYEASVAHQAASRRSQGDPSQWEVKPEDAVAAGGRGSRAGD